MNNREDNLKKINAELELMSDEELDKVSGGNNIGEILIDWEKMLNSNGEELTESIKKYQ